MSAETVERAWSDKYPCGRVHDERQPSRMKPACGACGRIHTSSDAVAVGRFRAQGPIGYRAANAETPIRSTRAEAEADECSHHTTPPGRTP